MDGKYVVLYSSNGGTFKQGVAELDSEEAAFEAIKTFKDPNVGRFDTPRPLAFRVARLVAAVVTKPVIETVVTRY